MSRETLAALLRREADPVDLTWPKALRMADAVIGAGWQQATTEPRDWQAGDPCAQCGSRRTVESPEGAQCLACGAGDDDE